MVSPMLTEKFISIVVICYKDAGSIHEMLTRLNTVMKDVTENWEVIYVNDASPDNSQEILSEESKNNTRLTVITHARNFGSQTAFSTGLLQAKGDAVVIMDGDLQDPPEVIHSYVEKWLEGNEVVFGVRRNRQESLIRNIGYKVFYSILNKISYVPLPQDAGEFSLMDRKVVDVILQCPENDRLIRGLRAYAGFRQVGVEFDRPSRFSGETTQSLLNYVMWAVQSFTSYSLLPLRLIAIFAITLSFVFIIMLFIFVGLYFSGVDSPPGFMTIIVVILFVGAIIMLSLGIIGEYMGRLFLEIKKRPQPIISNIINDQRLESRSWIGYNNDKFE